MSREVLLLQDDRGPVGDRGDPGQADLDGLGALRRVRPILTPRCRAPTPLARVEIGACWAKARQWIPSHRYGEASSSTRPLVSTAKRPVMTAASPATAANVTKTVGRPEAIISPTTVGPIMEANRSQAVAAPTAIARTRVG